MEIQDSQIWTRGATGAPLPPLADLTTVERVECPYLELYHKLGPIYRLPRQDGRPLVVLAGAEANAFTARYGDEFFVSAALWQEFSSAMGEAARDITNMRDGEANRRRRAQASRSWSRANVLDQLPRMLAITRRCSQWQPGQAIEVLPAMQRIVAEQLGQLLVNYSIGDYLTDFVIYLSTSIASSFGAKKGDATSSPRFQRARERAMELGNKIVEAHRASPPHGRKPDMVDEALARADAMPEVYTQARLVSMALGPLLAGLETVARTSTFLFYGLLTHPAALERVRTEAEAAFAHGELTWETLKAMPATHGAMMEALRMYTGSGFSAIAAQPFTFASHQLEAGDEVYVAIDVTHFLPELFPQPDVFDIDRYREPRNEQRQRGAYAPFGLGDHACLGSGIAEVQLMVIAATLLSTYQFELDPPDLQLIPGQHLNIADDTDACAGQQFHLRVTARQD